MAGDAQIADDALVLGLGERLDGAIGAEDLVEMVGGSDVVELPQVEVVGLQLGQTVLQQAQSVVAPVGVRLGGQEDVWLMPRP